MSTVAILENYLFLQPLIEQRLRAVLGAELPIEGIEELAQVGETDQRPKVVYVMWAGDAFDDSDAGRAQRGASQMVRQRWMVALRIRNVSQVDKAARHKEAGSLLSQIHKAIAGWSPEGVSRAFVRSGNLAPNYTKTSLYPLGFAIQLTL